MLRGMAWKNASNRPSAISRLADQREDRGWYEEGGYWYVTPVRSPFSQQVVFWAVPRRAG